MAAATLIGVVVGAALQGDNEPHQASPVQRPSAPPAPSDASADHEERAAGPGPDSSVRGVGVGFERSEAGAVAAAVSYATASQSWLYLSDQDVSSAAEAVIVPEARHDLVPQVLDDVRPLREELQAASGTVWFVVAPLATRVVSYSDRRAVVGVWVVQVLSAAGVAVPQSGWQTLTLELAWHSGDWLVAAVEEAEGPTPQLQSGLQPWSAAYLEQTLAGFVRVGIR